MKLSTKTYCICCFLTVQKIIHEDISSGLDVASIYSDVTPANFSLLSGQTGAFDKTITIYGGYTDDCGHHFVDSLKVKVVDNE